MAEFLEMAGQEIVPVRAGGAVEASPPVWIGQRVVDCASHPNPESVWPVRVRAGTFGPGRPREDLMLAPDQTVFLDGALVPVGSLVDGQAIARVPAERATYWHAVAGSPVVLAGRPATPIRLLTGAA